MPAMTEPVRQLSLRSKVGLAVRIWGRFLSTVVGAKQEPLPRFVKRLGGTKPSRQARIEPRRLGQAVERVLRLGPWRPRCLFTSLVLYRLLLEQGERPSLVIGLPRLPRDKDAHAWVEIDGVDVGPPPGRSHHEELARYG
jgi:hypothetical protein